MMKSNLGKKGILTILGLLFAFTSAFATAVMDFTHYQKPSDQILEQKLTPLQYAVTQKKATEKAFDNAYWNNTKPGIYVDIVSGEPLFSSTDKFDSKTGWPSFTKPITPDSIITRPDHHWFTTRTEVISTHAHSHLGHVFNDGPAPTYKRYCLNSAALKFIPVQDLKKQGYGQYLFLFKQNTSQKQSMQ